MDLQQFVLIHVAINLFQIKLPNEIKDIKKNFMQRGTDFPTVAQ